MKTLFSVLAIGLLLLGTAPLDACDNDSDSEPYEQRYQQQYEPEQPVTLALASQVTSPTAVAGIGLGGAMILASVAYVVLVPPRSK